MSDYNYATFDMKAEAPHFQRFPDNLHVGERAPDFPLEDLESGETVAIKDLWTDGPVVVEFGSFT
jgi:hypothetical protein